MARKIVPPDAHSARLSHEQIGMEAGLSKSDHRAVRLWLRLLACSTQIEKEIRTRLRTRYGTTLARFDYLAQLARHPEGLRMKALSRYLMVTGGNVTGLTDQLVADGLVEQLPDPHDRRAVIVRMKPKGKAWFERIAVEHERWLDELLGPLGVKEMDQLYNTLGHMRVILSQQAMDAATPR